MVKTINEERSIGPLENSSFSLYEDSSKIDVIKTLKLAKKIIRMRNAPERSRFLVISDCDMVMRTLYEKRMT